MWKSAWTYHLVGGDFRSLTTQELFQREKPCTNGLNAFQQSHLANRKMLKNPNGLFLGTPAPANHLPPSGNCQRVPSDRRRHHHIRSEPSIFPL
jgi:hypothetical protein